MSFGTSTESVRLKPAEASPLQPWQFFVLAGLGCATAATFLARGQGVVAVVLLAALMAATAIVGLAALRAVRPLLSATDDRTVMIGERTRAALEREKMLALRSIKELEFDRAMGKVSDGDFHEMSTRLRTRASRLMRQLDAGAGYREQIERDLAKRLGQAPTAIATAPAGRAPAERACLSCSTLNDADARFCKTCGNKL
jgi:ubiquitin